MQRLQLQYLCLKLQDREGSKKQVKVSSRIEGKTLFYLLENQIVLKKIQSWG